MAKYEPTVKEKTCGICNSAFLTTYGQRKFCSKECAREQRRRYNQVYNREYKQWLKSLA